ncbi:Conserved protein of uncharacterised function. Member of Mycobacterium tuberculosis REP13E12 (part1) [Mycobacterium tuberculosis]|nr:Conserved protein of uncharacterised function. Member of Mycobacterium tuberculosis REP13E12 (part1) [Mycobacterium tuberculosis]
MFEISLSDPVELRDADDAALLAAIEDCARAEVAAGARRLSAIAELTSRRCFWPGSSARGWCRSSPGAPTWFATPKR